MSQEAEWKVRIDETGAYEYELPNGEAFTISVPIGLCTQQPVRLITDEEQMVLEIYHNGKYLNSDDYYFYEEGNYKLSIITNNTDEMENIYNQYIMNDLDDISYQDIEDDISYQDIEDDISYQDIEDDINYQDIINNVDNIEYDLDDVSFYKADISFQICAPVVSSPVLIDNTDSFEVTSVTCNGVKVDISQGQPDWSKEGEYRILWSCRKDKNITYTTSFELDKTAPELIFSKEMGKRVLSPPIDIRPSEKDCIIQIVRGAEKYEANEITIKESGNYQMTVMDKAGNTNTYQIIVGMPMDKIYSGIVILLVFMLVAGIFIMRNARKHIQVL